MQLWQFLYTLLSDPNKKYSELIEWTSNIKEREFRLHEPECIAIWWGDHKNKRNMSYDKLSRSLRYYYDKGIIRKINGQRYVYRFCVDPEVMYRHIGNSDCRPKLKPMSQAARSAMSKYNHTYWGMLCPPHSATPNAAFTMPNGHILPPQYPVLTPSCMLPSSAFDQSYGIPVHDKLNPIDGQLYPEGPGTRQFQQQHLSLMGHCQNDSANYNFSHQKPFPTNYQECTLALTVEGAHFENVCSPQMHSPLAPVSHPSPTMLHRSYSPPLPPPYPFDYGSNNCDN